MDLPKDLQCHSSPAEDSTVTESSRSICSPESTNLEGNSQHAGPTDLTVNHLVRSCTTTASMKVKTVRKLSSSKGHFPTLAECAHFHYESADFGSVQLALVEELDESQQGELVFLVRIGCQGRNWMVRRSYEDFRLLDKHLHLCIYDRSFSQLPELPRLDSLKDPVQAQSHMLGSYLSSLSTIADNKINCGPVLTWMEIDNKGNHLLVHEESFINVPAIAAAHVIKRYHAQADDEISFEVGDMVSVIDMPPKEDTPWWRGKHGFQVGFFPSDCVELINDKLFQPATKSVPKAVSKKHGKLITFLRSFMRSRPSKQDLKQKGILRERVFGCDLGEHLLNSGLDVPQVLRSCTEFIEEHGVVDGIYRLSGIASNIQKLRHEFDSEIIPDLSKEEYHQDIHCVGSVCKLYFRELPNPLLTYQLYDKFSEAVSATTEEEQLQKMHDVIQQLPPPHYRTMDFLTRHLTRLATHSSITNMHVKNMAIVWAPNLLRSKEIESACLGGSTAFMEVRIQSVVMEFILSHVEVLFKPRPDDGPQKGTGYSGPVSRPKSLLVHSCSTRLLSLQEAQARTWPLVSPSAPVNRSYSEVSDGADSLQGGIQAVLVLPAERKKPCRRGRKSPGGSWRSFFSLGKVASTGRRKLRYPLPVGGEMKEDAVGCERLRFSKSEESLSLLHHTEGELQDPHACRPRSSSSVLSLCGSVLATPRRKGKAVMVPALISPPQSADDLDLTPLDIDTLSLDFDPMSYQCSTPTPPHSPDLGVVLGEVAQES